MSLLHKDAAALYSRSRTMSLGSTNQSLNKQTQLAAAKVIANRIANSKYDPQTNNDDGGSSSRTLTGRAKKRAERLEKLKKAKEDAAKLKELDDKKSNATTPKGESQASAADPAKNNGGGGAPRGK